jgi:hypothetical protein
VQLKSLWVKVKVKFNLEQVKKAQSGSRGRALLFLYPRRKMQVSGQRRAPAALSPGKKGNIRWAPGPFWTGAENLVPAGIRSPDRPARSESLRRFCYPDRLFFNHVLAGYRSILL